jgi:2TM domain
MITDEQRASIEREVRAKAVKRVRVKLGFYWHALIFALVNSAIVAINLHYTPQHIWFVWPLGGWGAALLLQAFATFGGQGMTEDMVQAEIKRELSRRGVA